MRPRPRRPWSPSWPPSWRRLDSRWDRVGRWQVHARTAAPRTGPRGTVVLVHGLGVSSRYLAPTALALVRRGWAVAAPDLPGYGRTRAAARLDLAGLADALAAWLGTVLPDERPVLLANSFGCQVVARVAARAPERFRGLVLVGPTVDRRARTATEQGLRWLRNGPKEPPVLGAILVLDYLQCGLARPAVAFRSSLDDAIEETLRGLPVPTLLLRGADDPIAPRRWLDELAAAMPNARVVELQGAAHTANYTAPEELAAALDDVTADP